MAANAVSDRHLAGVADALLVLHPALALAAWLRMTAPGAKELVSATSRAGFEPLTNYAQLAMCALIVAGVYALGYRRGEALLARAMRGVATTSLAVRAVAGVVALVALAAYVVNISASAISVPLSDAFHEGEYLGFVPMLADRTSSLASALTVHGPGVDLLPGLAAVRLGDGDHGIAVARIAYSSLRSAAVLASLLVVAALVELLCASTPPTQRRVTALAAFLLFATALQAGAWQDELALHKPLNARDAVYLWQMAAVLAFAIAQRRDSRAAALIAGLAGATLPWGVAYSYDRGLYGIAFLILASVVFAVCGDGWRRRWLTGLAAGALLGSTLLLALFGAAGVAAMTEQVSFWIRHGRDLWSYAGIVAPGLSWPSLLLGGALVVLAHGLLRVIAARRQEGNLAEAFRREIGVVLMLAASLPPLRMVAERADASHVAWGVTPAWLLLSALVARAACDSSGERRPVWWMALSALAGANLVLMNPFAAVRHLERQYVAGPRIADAQLLPPALVRARDVVAADLPADACFLTLTNESAWYYLVRRPSCTRFYHLTNARTAVAQREVVAALERAPPPIVLVASPGWSSSIDGISAFNASPIVMQYAMTHYVPDKVVDGHWFWRRAAEPLRFSGGRIGAIARAPASATRIWDLELAGSLSERNLPIPAALFLTADDVPVWTGRPNADEWRAGRFTVTVPTAALGAGRHRLRAWAFHDSHSPMLELGDALDLTIE